VPQALIGAGTPQEPNPKIPTQSREAYSIVTIVYLIAAALVVCGCLFFIMRVRSRD